MQSAIVIRQDERMLKVPRTVGSGFHFASGRTVTFPNGLIIVARRRELVGMCNSRCNNLDGDFADLMSCSTACELSRASSELLCSITVSWSSGS